MNKNGERVSGFTTMDNHHTAFVALQAGSFKTKDNRMTIKKSPQKSWAQVAKTLHMDI